MNNNIDYNWDSKLSRSIVPTLSDSFVWILADEKDLQSLAETSA